MEENNDCNNNSDCPSGPPPPPPCTPANPASAALQSPVNGSVGLMSPITMTWVNGSWGNSCPSSGLTNYLYYKVRQSGSCAVGSYTGINLGGITTTTTQSIFNFDSTYCWFIRKINRNRYSDSAVWTFNTANRPDITYSEINHKGACGATSSGREEYFPQTNNPITVVTELEDVNTDFGAGINSFEHARIGFLPAGVTASPVSYTLFDSPGLIDINNTAAFEVDLTNIGNPVFHSVDDPSTQRSTGNLVASSGRASLVDLNGTNGAAGPNPQSTRVEQIGNNRIRIYWTVRFENSFYNGDIRVFASVASNISGNTITQDAQASLVNREMMRPIEVWEVDTVDPIVGPGTPVPQSIDQFGLEWTFDDTDDTTAGPGNPNYLMSYCYTQDEEFQITDISDGGNPVQIDLLDRSANPPIFPGSPVEPSYCQVNELNWNTVFAPNGQRRYYIADQDFLSDINFTMYAQDNSCNESDDNSTLRYPGSWLVTVGSDATASLGYSGIKIPDVDFSGPPPTVTGLSDDAYLSSYSLIAGNAATVGRESKNDYISTNYENLGLIPPLILGKNNWYDHLYELADLNTNLSSSAVSALSGNFSGVLGLNPGDFGPISFSGNLSIASGSVCDVRGIFLVNGNLTIQPNLTRSSGNGCIFIVQGDITVETGQRTNPAGKPFTDPADYDVIEGFFITNGDFNTVQDVFGADQVPDPLRIIGGVHGTTVTLERELGIAHSPLQPSEIIEYDPFYIHTFRDAISVRSFSLRSKD